MFGELLLEEVNGEVITVEAAQFEGCNEEEVGVAHEVHLYFVCKEFLELFLLFLVLREEDKVIYVETYVYGLAMGGSSGIDDGSGE